MTGVPENAATTVTENGTSARRGVRLAARIVLGFLDVAGALVVATAWFVFLTDAFDHDSSLAAGIVAMIAIAGGMLMALLTGIAVVARWVSRRWLIAPALITAAGLVLCYWPVR
jgi:hypothetical protein